MHKAAKEILVRRGAFDEENRENIAVDQDNEENIDVNDPTDENLPDPATTQDKIYFLLLKHLELTPGTLAKDLMILFLILETFAAVTPGSSINLF